MEDVDGLVGHRTQLADQGFRLAAGLSLSRTKVLQALAGRGAVHQVELAAALGQAPRSVTQSVEGLQRLALISRTSHPEDRRRKTVELTPAGRTAGRPHRSPNNAAALS
ncbi:MarR family winged helix-turn-helix transcriptional regulator [Streptomyces sp. CRN 30]|uniref:MarR family winged helix-turn-helix transcriptional regulator n=1 Tax=Streptomyces sp. CRN 30 TaxID=3075613 RepID=UPI002A813A46|nr:MarR family winged helix-turn-helix transcriptional regulator [Streptomyces sp. CRN 30]